jgi:hypothetical protein
MKLTNTLATIMLTAFLAVGLSACGKKKNSSNNNAATPGSACVMNPQNGQWTNSAGQYCNPNATQGTITCPANGIYTNQYGQQQACTPGQVVNTGGTGYYYPGQYQYTNYMNQYGCDGYYYQYGVQYVPVILSGQLQCMRYDLLNQYSQGTPYYNNYDYYYAYPPYQTTNNQNQSCFFLNLGGIGGGYCGN